MNKIQSNPNSRSPSRVASHRAHSHSQPSTPGLIHLSPAMLQPLQQQQQHQQGTSAGKGSGRRSKGANQRTSKNSKQQQHTAADEGTATGSDADIFIDTQEAGKQRTPTPSMKQQRRQQRQQEHSADSAIEDDGSPAKGSRHAEGAAIQRATTPRRPKHKRGQSQATLAAQEYQEEHLSYVPSSNIDQTPSLLSKSAPTTSFLTRRNEGLQQKQQQQLSNNNIRSSNSADEWDMPLTANGHDALTWQQQSLGRKASNPTSSRKAGNKNGKKAGISSSAFDKTDVEAVKPHTPSGISIMAPQPQSQSARSSSSSHPTPVPTPSTTAPLTWQQELFQRSGPSTPSSQLFSALEEGHSGAHPAKETRTRSSPPKARSAHQNQKNTAHLSDGHAGDEMNLENSMSGLALNPSKKVAKQGKKAHVAASPMAIPNSVPKHSHFTRSSAKHHNQRTAASDSDADNSVEEEAANLSFGEEPSTTFQTAPESTRPIAMAASPTKSSLYAGPKFHNSPSAGQLPTPRLAAFLNRNKEGSPLPPSSGELLAA